MSHPKSAASLRWPLPPPLICGCRSRFADQHVPSRFVVKPSTIVGYLCNLEVNEVDLIIIFSLR
jgi:hypothetical protein